MRVSSIFLLALLCGVSLASAEGFQWQSDKPEAQGLSSAKLEAYRDDLAKHGTHGLLVIRHDRIVCEWYADGYAADKPHGTASMAKAMIGGMSLAVAMQDGRIKPDDPASKFIPAWQDDAKKAKITVGQLATHTSGLEDAEADKTPHDKLTGWKGEFWKREPTDPFTVSRDLTPVIYPPGERVSYSNPGIAMLSYAVTAAIQPGDQKDVKALLRDRLFRPIGMGDKEWSVGYGKPSRVAGMDLYANWGGAAFTARAAARIGRLMLREGDWDGHRLIDAANVRICVNPSHTPKPADWEGNASPSPGFGWWSNRDGAWKSVPRDTFMAAGAQHQRLIVIPSLDLIVVRNGTSLSTADGDNWSATERLLLAPLAAAVIDPPLPPSKVIRSIRFDDEQTIVRKAPDSDNWPITWGDDGHLYTSYGDGHGFEPFIQPKLSMGFARIDGGPTQFQGVNIRSETGDRTGDGAKGPKASGLVMVDHTLYLWVRNTRNATLAWSSDHGVTWTWGWTLQTSFGCPAFLNFGANYAGARDDYVYTYSQDGSSAYEPCDGVVLARVPRAKIRDRSAYEFYAGTDSTGAPTWKPDVAARAHTLHYPGHCERLDVVYSPAIRRYLMTLSYGHGQGWGIFDAPEPWGPWSVAFHTKDWGQGDTHGYRLPTQWISDDGKQMYVVFSGRSQPGTVSNDAFCVRRAVVEVER